MALKGDQNMRRLRWLPASPAPDGRTARRIQSAVMTAGVLATLVLLNVLAARHSVRWDATAQQVYALSDTTHQVLGRHGDPVRVYAFLEPGSPREEQILDLLREYSHASGGRIAFERVNPLTQPSLVQRFHVVEMDTLVLESGDRVEKVDPWDLMGEPDDMGEPAFAGEQALTRALIRLGRATRPQVYFLEGHGERPLDRDLYEVRRALEAEGYEVGALNLALEGQVPADADLVVLAGPGRDLAAAEQEALRRHAGAGRGLLVLADPLPAEPGLPRLQALLGRWGLALGSGLVVDPERNYMFDPAAPIPEYLDHEITAKPQAGRLAMVLPGARPVVAIAPAGAAAGNPTQAAGGAAQPEAGPRQWPLLATSPAAWADADPHAPAFDPATDRRETLALAYAAELAGIAAGDPPARLVVAGSAAFVADSAAQVQGNLDFFLGAVYWLTAHDEPRLSISPRQAVRRDLLVSGRDVRMVFWSTVAGLPLLVLACGGAVWWRRRHL